MTVRNHNSVLLETLKKNPKDVAQTWSKWDMETAKIKQQCLSSLGSAHVQKQGVYIVDY